MRKNCANSEKCPSESGLPPGQTLTRRFPVVGERRSSPDPIELDRWSLTIDGLVTRRMTLHFEDLGTFPREEWIVDVHCVTGWSRLRTRWSGIPLRALLKRVAPLAGARFVRFEAYSQRNHDTSLPLDYAWEHVLLADRWEGRALPPEHGFPLRAVTRGKYFYKSLKWLRRIELLATDRLGYWEDRYAYHNGADPYREERYAPRPMPREEFLARLERRDFRGVEAILDPKFSELLAGRDLTGAQFDGAQIKACTFRRCILRRASFRQANLTTSAFVGVDLEGADFRGCDLEGVRFQGANLKGADFRGCLLTATRFRRTRPANLVEGARFHASDLEALLEGEAEFLRQRGADIGEA